MNIKRIVNELKRGNLVIAPTDTVYGILADATNVDAVKKVYKAKNRDPKKPLILLMSDLEMLKNYTENLDPLEQEIIQKYLPGRLTILLQRNSKVSEEITAGGELVAIRIPDHEELREIIEKVGAPLISTSANLSGHETITHPDEIAPELLKHIAYVEDGGRIEGEPSSLIQIQNDKITVLRDGEVARRIANDMSDRFSLNTFKNMALGDVEKSTTLVALAPMEGVTDIVFRQVVARAGEIAARNTKLINSRPDLFFTEFTNVSSYASERGRANALERLQTCESDHPIIAQVWGKNPDDFRTCVAALEDLGFSGVDLNFGCPDRHVNRAGGGAAMIRTPDLAVECLHQAQDATELPVSVKTRLGYSQVDEYKTWLPILLAEHLSMLTVHLRTKKEMSKVPAHYEVIPEIVKLRDGISPETKLLINGDIKTHVSGEELVRQNPGVDGIMIGRGVLQNPFCFVRTASGEEYLPTPEDLTELLNYHLDLFEVYQDSRAKEGQNVSFEPMKRFFKVYINNFPGASDIRASLMETHTVPEAREVIAKNML